MINFIYVKLFYGNLNSNFYPSYLANIYIYGITSKLVRSIAIGVLTISHKSKYMPLVFDCTIIL